MPNDYDPKYVRTEEEIRANEQDRFAKWAAQNNFFDPSWTKEQRREACRRAAEEKRATKRSAECDWDRHQWHDERTDDRGYVKTSCRVCGKFYGYRNPRRPGVGILDDRDE